MMDFYELQRYAPSCGYYLQHGDEEGTFNLVTSIGFVCFTGTVHECEVYLREETRARPPRKDDRT